MLRRFLITISMVLVASVTSAVELQNGYVVTCDDAGNGMLLTAPGELQLSITRAGESVIYKVCTDAGAIAGSCDEYGFDLAVGDNHFVDHIRVEDCLIPGVIRSVVVLMTNPDPVEEPEPKPLPFPWQRTGVVTPFAYVPLPDPQPPIGEYTTEEILKAYVPFPDPQPPIGE